MKAVYFPNMSMPPLAWTHSVALYFDGLGIIAPNAYEADLSSPHTVRLVEVGLVEPMPASLTDWPREENERLLERFERRLRSGDVDAASYRIHAGKLGRIGLMDAFRSEGILKEDPEDSRWLIGPEVLCLEIMTILAQRIVRAGGADAIVTDEAPAFRISSGLKGKWELHFDRRTEAVTRLLPAAPWAAPEALAEFKAQHRGELRAFRGFVEALVRRDAEDANFESRLSEAERLRDHLSGELDAIAARADGPGLALAVANFVAPLLEASFFSAAVNGLSAMRTLSVDAHRRNEIDRDRLVYAAKASRALRAKDSSELLA